MSRRRGPLLALGALLAALGLSAGGSAPAAAADCSYGGCVADLERMPAGPHVNVADLIRRAQRFFGTRTKAYIVNSDRAGAALPYYLRKNPPVVMQGQIHVPEVYFFSTEFKNQAGPHYVWHYIIGHEMAHAHQDAIGLVDAMRALYANGSVVMVELHADFLAGFFLAREFGLSSVAIDSLLRELQDLPVGAPGDASYHGEPGERFFMATQGALMAFQRPTPALPAASARGVRCAFDILSARDGAGDTPLSELCK